MSLPDLFTPEELGRLDRLRILRRRTVRGDRGGEWRSLRHGAGGLFAEHRPYVAGDDLRYVDWNVYGRLGDLVVKRFEAEENIDLLLVVDHSASMAGAKSLAARRFAGALGYLALAHMDHVHLSWLPGGRGHPITSYRGAGRSPLLLSDLAGAEAAGSTDHVRDLARIVAATRRHVLVLLISDFYDPQGALRGLALLRARGLDVAAVHVLDAADAELPLGTSVLALDSETGETLRIDVTRRVLDRVRAAWQRRATGLERWCLGREIPFVRVDARRSLWDVLRETWTSPIAVGA